MVYEFTSDDSNTYTYGHRLLYSDDYKYVLNAHGDVVALLNSDGETVKEYDYDAFGNELNPSASDTNPFRYCAEYFDIESGQIYLRNRYYQPVTGRFTQLDPIRDGLNWYAYCYNNPIAFADPSGLLIAVSGSEEEQQHFITLMEQLTDFDLEIDMYGLVIIVGTSENIEHESSNELLQRMINNNDYTCTISATQDSHYAVAKNIDASENGLGSSSNVYLNLNPDDEMYACINYYTTNAVEDEYTPLYMVLAHELIHADRMMRGNSISNNVVFDYKFQRYSQGKYFFETHEDMKVEEALTIGLPTHKGKLKYNDITENQLRAEHSMSMRGAHIDLN